MKPGYKTTEFWLSLAALVLTTLFAAGVVAEGSAFDKVLVLVSGILTALGYTVGRSLVKGGEFKAKVAGSLTSAALAGKPADPTEP